MKAILLATIVAALKAYVGGGLFQRISALVIGLMERSELTGQQKMALVIDTAKREAMGLGETLIRAVAEIVLLKLKGA
jgi:hypothetical protein